MLQSLVHTSIGHGGSGNTQTHAHVESGPPPATVFNLSAAAVKESESTASASHIGGEQFRSGGGSGGGVDALSPSTPSYVPVQIGTLDISAALQAPAATAAATTAATEETLEDNSFVPKAKTLVARKPGALLKKPMTSSRVMAVSSNDVKLESFENMEKRRTRELDIIIGSHNTSGAGITTTPTSTSTGASVSQEALLSPGSSSSRLNAIYAASQEQPTVPPSPSKYQEQQQPATSFASKPSPKASSTSGGGRYGNLSAASTSTTSSSSNNSNVPGRYTGAKSISSDQFFGRDITQQEEARSRLGNYTNNTSISSDMLNGNDDGYVYQGNSEPDDAELVATYLKDSVKGFFDGIQRHLST